MVLGLVLGSCGGFLLGCGSSIAVKAAYDPAAPFSKYRTFAMLEPNLPVPTGLDIDPFTLQRLRQLTFEALEGRGLRAVALGQADLHVAVLARSQERVEVDPYGGTYMYGGPAGYYARYGGYGYGPVSTWSAPSVRRYQEDVVAIDLIDPKENAVRWRGVGSQQSPSAKSDANLREMVQRILSLFPPKAVAARAEAASDPAPAGSAPAGPIAPDKAPAEKPRPVDPSTRAPR